MRILFTSRIDSFDRPGGDTIHLQTIADELQKRGHELFFSIEECDQHPHFIHHFNIGRPELALEAVNRFKDAKLLINTIYVDYSETDKYSESKWRRIVVRLLGNARTELAKELVRFAKSQRSFPNISYILKGHGSSCQLLLERSSYLICASSIEELSILRDFKVDSQKFRIIAPPIRESFFNNILESDQIESKGAVCVARIEPLKNQLRVIQAWEDRFGELLIVGNPAPNHFEFYNSCKTASIGKKVRFVPEVKKMDELIEIFDNYRLHIMPSLYETTGLSTVENLVRGGRSIVSPSPIMKEIFNSRVEYADPLDIQSIKRAIETSLKQRNFKENQSWATSVFHPMTIVNRIEDLYLTLEQ